MLEIAAAWEIIERVLGEHAPDVVATFRAPVSDADLGRLAATVGRELPADLVASLRIHDGQEDPGRLIGFVDFHILLGAEEMIDQHAMLAGALGSDLDSDECDWMTPDKVRTISNCQGWLQFADAEGQGLAVDLDPLPAGDIGQVIWLPGDGPTPAPITTSYGAWLGDVATKLDDGAFEVSDLGVTLIRAAD